MIFCLEFISSIVMTLGSMGSDSGKKEGEECPHCGSTRLELEKDKRVCMECGAVIEDTMVSSEQEQFYSYEEAVKEGRHSFGSQATPKTKTDRKNLRLAISLINELVNKLHLPYFVKEEAIKVYKQLMGEESIRKDKVPAISTALVYLVCRKSRISLPLDRATEESDTDKSDVIKNYMRIIELLKIEIPPPSVEGLALLFAKKAGLQSKTIAFARKIARRLKKEFVNIGKDPNGIAAAAVYTAAKKRGEDTTQKEIAKIASITEVTIRNRFIEVKKAIERNE